MAVAGSIAGLFRGAGRGPTVSGAAALSSKGFFTGVKTNFPSTPRTDISPAQIVSATQQRADAENLLKASRQYYGDLAATEQAQVGIHAAWASGMQRTMKAQTTLMKTQEGLVNAATDFAIAGGTAEARGERTESFRNRLAMALHARHQLGNPGVHVV